MSASCELVGEGVALRCAPLQYSADAAAEGDAIYLGMARPEDVEALEERGVELAGKVVVAHSFMPWLVAPALAEKGVAALVNVTETGDGLIPNFMCSFYPNGMDAPWGGRVQPMPGVTIETTDARRLLSLMSTSTVRIRVEHRARYVEASSANVVAEIPGRELPDERVVIGAHYDTQLEGVGAADNSTGVATVLELAHRWRELTPRRTIVLCTFGVEELASWGLLPLLPLAHRRACADARHGEHRRSRTAPAWRSRRNGGPRDGLLRGRERGAHGLGAPG